MNITEKSLCNSISIPQISIIIPCYNIDSYLPKCIESLLSQTFSNFELLLINDGSSDTTLNICEQYAKTEHRIRVYSHENKGVSFTRNRGIELAQGDYIMFVDGDDWVKEDFIAKLFFDHEEYTWPISGMINVKGSEIVNSGYFIKLLKLFPDRKIGRNNFLKVLEYYSLSSPCARIYSKNIVIDNNIWFQEKITYQEDLVFNLVYLKYIQYIKLIDYFGYNYVQHKNSSTANFHKNFEAIEILFDNLKTMIISNHDKLIVKEFIFQTVLRKISNIFHKNSNKNFSEKIMELSILFHSSYFNFTYDYIYITSINLLLKTILKLKSPRLIIIYFKIKRY